MFIHILNSFTLLIFTSAHGNTNCYHNFICYFLKRPATAMLNSNEFGPVVA